jgi:hypothetical protein
MCTYAADRLHLRPVTRDQALAFIAGHHRHARRPVGYRFAVGVHLVGQLVGVATAGRPVARHFDDGWTLEVTRVCTDGTANVCSMLYAACWRSARALGYQRAITYTLASEPGTSLRAAGWQPVAIRPARPGWNTPTRPRTAYGIDGVARMLWHIHASSRPTPSDMSIVECR